MVTWADRTRRRLGDSRRHRAAFTLLELIIVIAIIGILAAIVMPGLSRMPTRAREAALKTNLRTLRDAIDQHYGDKGAYPKALGDLVSEKYIRNIPRDPITHSAETWVVIYETDDSEDVPPETDQDEEGGPGIIDVRSGAATLSLAGTPYAEW